MKASLGEECEARGKLKYAIYSESVVGQSFKALRATWFNDCTSVIALVVV